MPVFHVLAIAPKCILRLPHLIVVPLCKKPEPSSITGSLARLIDLPSGDAGRDDRHQEAQDRNPKFSRYVLICLRGLTVWHGDSLQLRRENRMSSVTLLY